MKVVIIFLGMFVLLTTCKPAPENKVAIGTIATLEAAREIMLAGTCTLVTVTDGAMPHARVMDPLDPDENFEVWLATNPRSRKIEHLSANPNVVLHYIDQVDNGYVSLYGNG
jgi:general stress protein 26